MELLSDEEFDLLTEDEQDRYLSLLDEELDAWSLTPKQQIADRLADEVDEILYGGAAGGGKSNWMLHRANRLSLEIPGHSTLILRTVFPELRRTLIRSSIQLFAKNKPDERPRWRAADKEWRYPNGSVIEFGYCETDDDVGQFLSSEYDMIMFDELSEFTLYQYNMIRSRARTTKRKRANGARPHIVGATNPGRRGMRWVKARFVMATDYGRTEKVWVMPSEEDEEFIIRDEPTEEQGERCVGFVHATVFDNPHIDPDYVSNLMSQPALIRRQYLDGDWDIFEGQYFTEFTRAKVMGEGDAQWLEPWHVISPFDIPHEWPRYRAIDYGTFHPFVCLWIALDGEGIAYVYREVWRTGMTASEQARLIKEMSICRTDGRTASEKIEWSVADPSMWASRSSESPALQYANEKVFLLKGDNERLAGWNKVREWLRADVHGRPGLRIFDTCPNLVRTIPEMIHDKSKPEDLDTTLNDHGLDALRYWAMRRPRVFVPPKQPEDTSTEARIRRKLEAYDGRRTRHHPELGRIS